MSRFTIKFIEDLEPQASRYDAYEDKDFLISVMPNGVKVWVYVHTADQSYKRETLGVYPEMDILAARAALATARLACKIREIPTPFKVKADEPIKAIKAVPVPQELDLPVVAPKREDKGRGFKSTPALTLGGLALAGTVLVVGLVFGLSFQSTTSEETIAQADSPLATLLAAQPMEQVGAAMSEGSVTEEPEPSAGDDAQTQVAAETAIVTGIEESASIPEVADHESVEAIPTQVAELEPNPGDQVQLEPARVDTNPLEKTETTRSHTPVLAMAPEQSEPAQSGSNQESVTPKISTQQVQAAMAPLGQADVPPATPRVARAQLTREVRQREPIDDLGARVALTGEEVQTVYFFTDLRGLTGRNRQAPMDTRR